MGRRIHGIVSIAPWLILVGALVVLIFVPPWMWFALIGIGLVVLGIYLTIRNRC